MTEVIDPASVAFMAVADEDDFRGAVEGDFHGRFKDFAEPVKSRKRGHSRLPSFKF